MPPSCLLFNDTSESLKKRHRGKKGKELNSLFINNVIVYVENPKGPTNKLLE